MPWNGHFSRTAGTTTTLQPTSPDSIGEHQDLISKAEEGLCADVLLLLLSQSSVP